MARSSLLLLLLAGAIFSPGPAFAEVRELTPKAPEYFQLMFPGAFSGSMRTPIVLLMPDSSRVERVIAPFEAGSSGANAEPLIAFLNGERSWESVDTGIENERYHAAVTALAADTPLRFPVVVLVRWAPPRSESDVQLPAAASVEGLVASLSEWAGEQPDKRSLLVVTLQPR